MTDIEVTTSDSSEAVAAIQVELNESQASLNTIFFCTHFHYA